MANVLRKKGHPQNNCNAKTSVNMSTTILMPQKTQLIFTKRDFSVKILLEKYISRNKSQ